LQVGFAGDCAIESWVAQRSAVIESHIFEKDAAGIESDLLLGWGVMCCSVEGSINSGGDAQLFIASYLMYGW
jgi:hypothetical protein